MLSFPRPFQIRNFFVTTFNFGKGKSYHFTANADIFRDIRWEIERVSGKLMFTSENSKPKEENL
jgi:hypothetical protein